MSSEDPFHAAGEKPHGDPRFDKIVRIMITVIILFFLAVPFVLVLQVYAERIWRDATRIFRAGRPRNAGLDPQIIGTLPTFPYRSQNFSDGRNCAVCQYAFEENEEVRLLPNCKHIFHVHCIDRWILSQSTCPLCRKTVQPRQPVLESARVEQVLTASSEPSTSGIHDNLNSEQGQSASSGEEFNLQKPTAILSSGMQEQMTAEMDEATSEGRALMPLRIEQCSRPDVFSSPLEALQPCSPNSSQSSSRSPVARHSSPTRIARTDRGSIQVCPSDHPAECDSENNDQ